MGEMHLMWRVITISRTPAWRSGVRSRLDDLEIAIHLPVGDGLAEFAFLPFARRGVMVDERIAEQLARRPRRLEALRGIPQGARQLTFGRMLLFVGVAFDRLVRLDAMLDAPETRADRRGERDIRIDVGGGDSIFDALATSPSPG